MGAGWNLKDSTTSLLPNISSLTWLSKMIALHHNVANCQNTLTVRIHWQCSHWGGGASDILNKKIYLFYKLSDQNVFDCWNKLFQQTHWCLQRFWSIRSWGDRSSDRSFTMDPLQSVLQTGGTKAVVCTILSVGWCI